MKTTLLVSLVTLILTGCNGGGGGRGSGGGSGGTSASPSPTTDENSDPLYQYAWYINNSGQSAYTLFGGTSGYDVKAQDVHLLGVKGAGVTVAVSDTGIETTHEDLLGNFKSDISKNFLLMSPFNGSPVTAGVHPSDAHGTAVTGIISAVGWNGKGSRGVAPLSKFGGFNFLADTVTQSIDQRLYQMEGPYDIFNYSYGPATCSYVPFNDEADRSAIVEGYENGVSMLRNGKGAIYLQAAGNEYRGYDPIVDCYSRGGFWESEYFGNAVLSEGRNYPYLMVIGAVDANGVSTSYSNPGSNLWVVAPGGEDGFFDPAIVTTDLTGCSAGMSLTNTKAGCDYTTKMNGTSSATPVASGVVALLLSANPNLSWRDVRHILATTARQVYPESAATSHPIGINLSGHVYQEGWTQNSAGYFFHNWYGLIDAKAAVTMAQNYSAILGDFKKTINVNDDSWIYDSGGINNFIPNFSATGTTDIIDVFHNYKIEAVQIRVSIAHNYISNLGIELTSPSGTKSIITNINSMMMDQELDDALFLTNAFYGEDSVGSWTLKVIDGSDLNPNFTSNTSGYLTNWKINIFGHIDADSNDQTDPTPIANIVTAPYSISDTEISANFDANSDPDFLRYEYCVGRSTNLCDIYTWTSNENYTTLYLSGLTLTSGTTYYLNLRSVDNSENVSELTSTFWEVDTEAPTAISNLVIAESITTAYLQTPTISWNPSVSSDIAFYEYSIGTSSGGTQKLGWTSNSLNTTLTHTGLNLTPNSYYINVRAVDLAGNKSGITTSSWQVTKWRDLNSSGSPESRAAHSAIWNGTEMIIWGGGEVGPTNFNSGYRYNKATETWSTISTINAPSARFAHTAIWTGTEMIIWGGEDATYIGAGGRYNPTTDSWITLPTLNAPTARSGHTVIWTGSEMIIFGGKNGTGFLNDGARYNPTTNTWAAISSVNAPTIRYNHTAVWSGSYMIVWGGYGGSYLNNGARYNPTTNSWSALPAIGIPARTQHSTIWTGTEMVVWGGYAGSGVYLNSGYKYNPTTNQWTTGISTTDAPSGRMGHLAVYTGSKMIVWGGQDGAYYYGSGAIYNFADSSWTQMTNINAPIPRSQFSGVWTGDSFLIWGGENGTELGDGKEYMP